MIARFLDSIHDIEAGQWDALFATDYPFIQHCFLRIMEEAGITTMETGWQVQHLVIYDETRPVAAMPCYRKSHSYGEYVFDFQWARAYQQSGLPYYPKLLTAIPYAPVTGPRLGIHPESNTRAVLQELVSASIEKIKQENLSSWHVLFVEQSLSRQLIQHDLFQRIDVQFHWCNRGYRDFDHFLQGFNSRHRKNVRKERRQVIEQGIVFVCLEGQQINADQLKTFYRFYQRTYLKRSGHGGYLNLAFFSQLIKHMPDHVLMVAAYRQNEMIAAALSLKDQRCLYGRYWGCDAEFDFLHFETCFYQGIEYCIEHGLQCFDSGAQGEHKIQRGFEPVVTHSCHYVEDPLFRQAITHAVQAEQQHVNHYKQQAEQHLPFRRS